MIWKQKNKAPIYFRDLDAKKMADKTTKYRKKNGMPNRNEGINKLAHNL